MSTDDRPTIPPPPELWPIELVIAEQIQAEIDERSGGLFERLYIEQIYIDREETTG